MNPCFKYANGSGSVCSLFESRGQEVPMSENVGFRSDATLVVQIGRSFGQPVAVEELASSEKYMEASRMYMRVTLPYFFLLSLLLIHESPFFIQRWCDE